MISYGGVTLPVLYDRIRSLSAFVDGSLPLSDLVDLSEPEYAATGTPWYAIQKYTEAKARLGHLIWYQGASRWARGDFLVTDDQLPQLRTQAYANGVWNKMLFEGTDGTHTISTYLYMLPPHPIGKRTDSGDWNGIYLLTLVDVRYLWWRKSAQFSVTGSESWADLFDAIGTALDEDIVVEAISADYLTPSPGLTLNYDGIPLLFDAAAYSVGKRVVRTLDGVVTVQSAATAQNQVNDFYANNKTQQQAGGMLALNPLKDPNDVRSRVPESVVVRFPIAESGTLVPASHAETVTLADQGYATYGDAIGYSGSKLYHTTCVYHTTGAIPDNAPEVTALAEAIAGDYYAWALGGYDLSYAQVAEWVPTGNDEYVEWQFMPNAFYTRVQASDTADLAVTVFHYGTYFSSDQSGIWLYGDLWWGQPTAGGGGVPVVSQYPITGVGTFPDPIRLVPGTGTGDVFGWNGTSWTLSSFPEFTYSGTVWNINYDPNYLAVTSNIVSLSPTVIEKLTSAGTLIPCRVRDGNGTILGLATQAGNTITANVNGALPNIDGVALSVGDYVFIYPGSAAASNGPWKVTSLGSVGTKFTFIRAPEMDTSAEARGGIKMNVWDGTFYATQMWELVTNGVILNTTPIAFKLVAEEILTDPNYMPVQIGENSVESSTVKSTIQGTTSDSMTITTGWNLNHKSFSIASTATSISLASTSSRTILQLVATASGKGLKYIGDNADSDRTILIQNIGADAINLVNDNSLNGLFLSSNADESLSPRGWAMATFDTDLSPDRWRVQRWCCDGTTPAVTTSRPLTGTGTVADPVRLENGTTPKQVPAWNGTTWPLTSIPIMTMTSSSTEGTFAFNSEASQFTQVGTSDDVTLTLSAGVVASLAPQSLATLTDVSLNGMVANGDAVVYNSTIGFWTNEPAPGISPIALDDLTDVSLSMLSTGQVLTYSGTIWVNAKISLADLSDVAGSFGTDNLFAYDGADWVSRSVANCFSSAYPGASNGDVWSKSAGTWQPVAAATVKAAIVEDGKDAYVGLSCVEAPDVRFEDVAEVHFNGTWSLTTPIDPMFMTVCEPDSIVPVGIVSASPAVLGASVEGNELLVQSQSLLRGKVWVKLSGIRKGFSGNRFPPYTQEDADKNNRFWGAWRKS